MKEKKVLGEKMELNSINCASAEFFKVLWGTEPPYGKSTFIKKKKMVYPSNVLLGKYFVSFTELILKAVAYFKKNLRKAIT